MNDFVKELLEKPERLGNYLGSTEFLEFISWFRESNLEQISESHIHHFQVCDKNVFKNVVESIWQHQGKQGLIESEGYVSVTIWEDLEISLMIGQGSEYTLSKYNKDNSPSSKE